MPPLQLIAHKSPHIYIGTTILTPFSRRNVLHFVPFAYLTLQLFNYLCIEGF